MKVTIVLDRVDRLDASIEAVRKAENNEPLTLFDSIQLTGVRSILYGIKKTIEDGKGIRR